jgi:hypothetical protein
MDYLRDFLQSELGQKAPGIPLSALIARCYQEFLVRAHNGQKGKIPPGLLQEHLRRIAAELLTKDPTIKR